MILLWLIRYIILFLLDDIDSTILRMNHDDNPFELYIITNTYNFAYKTKRISICQPFLLLRGLDSNERPLGYEPNELPLLHPAIYFNFRSVKPLL